MSINDSNIKAGVNEMIYQLDHAKSQQQAEVVANRLRADFMDCLSQGDEGKVRWNHIVDALKSGEKQGQGFDLQVHTSKNGLPELTLVDSQKGITLCGVNMGRDQIIVNEDHTTNKGFTPYSESEAGPRSVKPLEMQ